MVISRPTAPRTRCAAALTDCRAAMQKDADLGTDEDAELDGGGEHLMACCGQKRPLGRGAREVVVKPTTGGGRGFVTIHDFI